MTQFRKLIPALGILMWCALIMLFDRHDLVFYALTLMFSLTLIFLGLAHSGPRYVEVKIEKESNDYA